MIVIRQKPRNLHQQQSHQKYQEPRCETCDQGTLLLSKAGKFEQKIDN